MNKKEAKEQIPEELKNALIDQIDKTVDKYKCLGPGSIAHDIMPIIQEYAEQYHQQQLDWVNVKDRLPEEEGLDWLVLVKNKNKEGGIFIHDVAQYEQGKWSKSSTWEDVVYWMPLPTPPKH